MGHKLPSISPPFNVGDKASLSRRARALAARDPGAIIRLARVYSTRAVACLVKLMEEDGTPPAVRVRAAEIIIERAYGKAAMAVLVGTDSGSAVTGREMSIAEKIVALKLAQERGGETVELEGSQAREVTGLELVESAPAIDLAPEPEVEDLIG